MTVFSKAIKETFIQVCLIIFLKNSLFRARNKVHKFNLVVNDMPLSPHFGYDHLGLYC